MEELVGNVEVYQSNRPKVFEVPFNSTNKWQLSVHDLNDSRDPRFYVAMKVNYDF